MSTRTIKKMAAGSLIGTIITIPQLLLLANILLLCKENTDSILIAILLGAIFLALMGKQALSLISILPLSILFMGLRHLYWAIGLSQRIQHHRILLLGITTGPLLIALLTLLNREERNTMAVERMKEISIPKDARKMAL